MVSQSAVLLAALCVIAVTTAQIQKTAEVETPESNREARFFGIFKKLIGGHHGDYGEVHSDGYGHQDTGYAIYPTHGSSGGYGSPHTYAPTTTTTTKKPQTNYGQRYFNPYYNQNYLANHRYLVDATRDKTYLDEHDSNRSILSFFFRKNGGKTKNKH